MHKKVEGCEEKKNTPVDFYSSREKHRKKLRSRGKRDTNARKEQKKVCVIAKVYKQMCNLSHFRGMVI